MKPDGVVDYNGIGLSYGSPYTGWMQYSLANLLSPEGELILTDGSISVFDSYGSPDIRYTTFWWVDISGVPDSYLHNDVSYSYGYGNGFALRTRTTPSSTLRIMSARVVPSTTEASPTLAPYTGFSIDFVDAWQVFPDGNVSTHNYYGVHGSYG